MSYTDQQLIEKFLEAKSHIAKRQAALETELKPWADGMTAIENEFLRRLDERGAQNSKTDAGTAYKSTITNYAVTDQTAFLDYCLAHRAQGALDMLGIKAVKDPVKEWANGGSPPPGLEQSQRINVNIRRS